MGGSNGVRKAKRYCHPERSEGSASNAVRRFFVWASDGEKIFRLRPGEPIAGDLHRNHEWFEKTNSGTSEGRVPGFTSKYRVHRLVHFESFQDVRDAIGREKEIKGWGRAKKVTLIEATNPNWDDLADEWFPKYPSLKRGPQAGS
jgi:predicted GIY-YIG superfamily endonuclease